jgi:hypothetical protein
MRRHHSAAKRDNAHAPGGTRSAEPLPVTSVGTEVVWELRSNHTAATVKCVMEEYQGGHCLIRITHANRDVMNCWHASREEAIRRASVIETDLLHTGWGATAPMR